MIRITGRLKEVVRDGVEAGVSDYVIVILDEEVKPVLECDLPVGREGQLAGFRPGQQITIRGRCDGLIPIGDTIRIKDCNVDP